MSARVSADGPSAPGAPARTGLPPAASRTPGSWLAAHRPLPGSLVTLTLAEAASRIEAGLLDPVALTEAYLARIAETEPDLNAYTAVDITGALAAAEEARREIASGRYRGPLHGIPVGIKDLVDTAGLTTAYGSPRYRDHVPTTDAVVVARLRSAGAVILGKHATHEFAWGGRTDSAFFGPTRNPHDLTRIPGGSSGGGAASLAAHSSLIAIGSDTAGSVRIPAACCGIVGYKPAHDWISLAGVFPLEPRFDTLGVMARSVPDIAMAARVLGDGSLAGPGNRGRHAPSDGPGRGLRVGILTGPDLDTVDDAVREGLGAAVEALRVAGAELVEVPVPAAERRVQAVFTRIRGHGQAVHGAAFAADPGSYGSDLAELLAMPPLTEAELAAADRILGEVRADLLAVLGGVDVLLGPTEPMVAPRIGAQAVVLDGVSVPIEFALTRFTSIANVTGLPAMSVPAPHGPAAAAARKPTGRLGVPGDPGDRLPVGVHLQCAAGGADALMRTGWIVMGCQPEYRS